MGLRDEITADIAEAFDDELKDVVTEFTGSRIVQTGEPDPISQEVPTDTDRYSGRGVFGSYSDDVIDGIQILRTDVKITALQAEVTDQPRIDDTISQKDGPMYKVVHVGKDAANVSWIIQVRSI